MLMMTTQVPEVVPFRLTPNLLGALGLRGVEGHFRDCGRRNHTINSG
jgi:phosphatidylinositol kinase/protein kinase (PI-3  family)